MRSAECPCQTGAAMLPTSAAVVFNETTCEMLIEVSDSNPSGTLWPTADAPAEPGTYWLTSPVPGACEKGEHAMAGWMQAGWISPRACVHCQPELSVPSMCAACCHPKLSRSEDPGASGGRAGQRQQQQCRRQRGSFRRHQQRSKSAAARLPRPASSAGLQPSSSAASHTVMAFECCV